MQGLNLKQTSDISLLTTDSFTAIQAGGTNI